jgi:hypothetical protein
VREYPTSKLVDPAKKKLTTAGVPIPQPDPVALQRAKDDRKYLAQRPGLIKRTTAMIHSGPDVTGAAHSGQPNLQPPPEATSATDILRPGAPTPGGVGSGVASGNSVAVETVPVGSSDAGADNSNSVPASDAAPSDAGSLPAPMENNAQPVAQPPTAPAEAAPAPGTAPAERPAPDAVATVGMTAGATGGATAATTGSTSTESSSTTPGAKPNANDEQTAASAAVADPKSESTSKKKKKGLKKIVPW